VEDELFDGLQENIDILIDDWKREGADEVFVFTHPKGVNLNPSEIREFLRSVPNLEGVFLIGELPVPRIQMDPQTGTQINWYATDYFFMELEGDWSVSENTLVSYQNLLPPTIFVGRLVIGEDTGQIFIPSKPTILEFYNRYLEKLHLFRFYGSQHSLVIDGKREVISPQVARNNFKVALVNNWGGDVQVIVDWLAHLYARENIVVHEDVNKNEYRNILSGSFDYLAFRSHSNPAGHSLEDGTRWNSCDYLTEDPDVNFFELTACDTGGLIWEESSDPYDPSSEKVIKLRSDLLAWNILFAETGGLIVLAPSIGGGMNNVTVFYDKLREGGTFGEAFRLWAEYMNSFGDPKGWAFMLFFGDPFIRFDVPNYDCVIITSLIGTLLESTLPIMRLWRDKVFRSNIWGRLIIRLFYCLSPYLSTMTIKSHLIRSVNRSIITKTLKMLELTPLNTIVKSYVVRKAPRRREPDENVPDCKTCKKLS